MVQSEGINPESQSRFEKYLYLKPTLHYSALGQEIGVTPVTATLSLCISALYCSYKPSYCACKEQLLSLESSGLGVTGLKCQLRELNSSYQCHENV